MVEDKNKTNAEMQKRMAEDYRRTFLASKHGRRVLEDLLQHTGVFAHCETAKDEGRRGVGLQILSYLDKKNFKGMTELENAGIGVTEFATEEYDNG